MSAVRVAEVSKATGLRVAHTPCEHGFLIKMEANKRYRVGPAAISVGLATVASMTLPSIAEPFLTRLRDITGETVQLAVPDGDDVVIVGRTPSRQFPPNTIYIGHRVPIHAGSLGRAMLSTLTPKELSTLLARIYINGATQRSRTTVDEIAASVADAAKRGWALNDQETTLEHRSLAAPVCTPSGRAVGAINITVSAQRLSARELARKHAATVVGIAQEVTALLPDTFAGRQYVM
ncbi:IclR family transcriptional regulator [Rhodococcus sp. IEGM 1354]|uniref:IclR family transcriptional regulator n=1 Tax=Rhodococcus sp. IEGM 1354 TaxID=3047088 RepID=UPI0024B813B8|nr:IclR family transcriptional regulator [Rhodococcus sp. IEGM 1354]MDI9930715.1 IclR family transcriptional regulator [Rhodococcus sp. IEGM 1354]